MTGKKRLIMISLVLIVLVLSSFSVLSEYEDECQNGGRNVGDTFDCGGQDCYCPGYRIECTRYNNYLEYKTWDCNPGSCDINVVNRKDTEITGSVRRYYACESAYTGSYLGQLYDMNDVIKPPATPHCGAGVETVSTPVGNAADCVCHCNGELTFCEDNYLDPAHYPFIVATGGEKFPRTPGPTEGNCQEKLNNCDCCGNGVRGVAEGEQCDGGDGATCSGIGSGGTFNCFYTCKPDYSECCAMQGEDIGYWSKGGPFDEGTFTCNDPSLSKADCGQICCDPRTGQRPGSLPDNYGVVEIVLDPTYKKYKCDCIPPAQYDAASGTCTPSCSTEGVCDGFDGAVCTPASAKLSNVPDPNPEKQYAQLSTVSGTRECTGITPVCNCAKCNPGYEWSGAACVPRHAPCDPYVSYFACYDFGGYPTSCLGTGLYSGYACCSSYPSDYNYNYWVKIEIIN